MCDKISTDLHLSTIVYFVLRLSSVLFFSVSGDIGDIEWSFGGIMIGKSDSSSNCQILIVLTMLVYMPHPTVNTGVIGKRSSAKIFEY